MPLFIGFNGMYCFMLSCPSLHPQQDSGEADILPDRLSQQLRGKVELYKVCRDLVDLMVSQFHCC